MRAPPFAAFLEEHRSLVYRYLHASVGPQDADDCFQETFLSALRAYPRLRSAENLRAWVLAIATRKIIDHLRRAGRRPVPLGEVPETAAPQPPDGQPELWAAVSSLPPGERAVMVQRYVLDLPYAEIAAALGCSEEAARSRALAARRKLRTILSRGEDEQPYREGGVR